jgi:hypothetical protein
MKRLFLLIFLLFFIADVSKAQITRGSQPGELYISTDWYMDNSGNIHYAIFHSTNNGENIHLKYENIETPPGGEMCVGGVLGDATPGALYNYGNNELWVSFDYGEMWEYIETYGSSGRFASGFTNGEIYKCCANVQGSIWRSEDYGSEFIEVTQNAKYILEVGNNAGNLYGFDGSPGIGFNLHFSTDYGVNFIEIPVDSTIAFWEPSGMYPKISRGTEPGELYLVSWWLNSNYKIFHCIDTGYTWTEKFESDYIDLYYWRVVYTAGRDPGSFYVMCSTLNPTLDHVWLYIDYSSDYGETFTTYFHDLDSLFTSIESKPTQDFKMNVYPNPFTKSTTFHFSLPLNSNEQKLTIYDLYGNKIVQYNITGKNYQQWNGTDNEGNKALPGVYFYQINYGNVFSKLYKLIILN